MHDPIIHAAVPWIVEVSATYRYMLLSCADKRGLNSEVRTVRVGFSRWATHAQLLHVPLICLAEARGGHRATHIKTSRQADKLRRRKDGVRCEMCDVRCAMCDVRCAMCDELHRADFRRMSTLAFNVLLRPPDRAWATALGLGLNHDWDLIPRAHDCAEVHRSTNNGQ
jgi:hypothetical protein